jgi:hypothetical protein
MKTLSSRLCGRASRCTHLTPHTHHTHTQPSLSLTHTSPLPFLPHARDDDDDDERQTLMYHADKDNPDEEDRQDYDLDQFVALMISVVDDRLHRIRPSVAHTGGWVIDSGLLSGRMKRCTVAHTIHPFHASTKHPTPIHTHTHTHIHTYTQKAPVQHALDLLALAQFALVVVAIAKFRQIFYSAWVWWLLLAVRCVFTIDLAYRASRLSALKFFLKVNK